MQFDTDFVRLSEQGDIENYTHDWGKIWNNASPPHDSYAFMFTHFESRN